MNRLAFTLLFVSSLALADVGPPPPRCSVPNGCRSCAQSAPDCRASALDAGLIESDCSDGHSVPTNYFCPPGVVATRGCSSVDVLGLSALAALLFRRRR
jgi:uncharacterized protein (TIGR03382 family)